MNKVKTLIGKVLKINKGLTILLLICAIGVVTFSLVPPQILKIIVDSYLARGLGNQLFKLSLIYFGFLVLIGFFDFVKEGLLTVLGQKITREIRSAMMSKLKRMKAGYFTFHETGSTVSRYTNDVDAIQAIFTNGVIGMAIDIFKILGIIISICFFSKSLGVIVFLLIPIIYVITRFFQKRMLKVQIQNRMLVGRVNNHIPETIKNIQMIRSFRKEKYMEEKYKKYLMDSYDTIKKINFYDSVFSPIILIIRAIVIALMVILVSDDIAMLGISIGMVAAAIELISNIFSPIESLGMELQSIQQAIAGIRRVNEFLNEVEDKEKISSFKNQNFSNDISIEFQNVSFYYEEGQDILKNVSFKINPKEDVSFVGRTGAGKSTLFKLMLGLLEPIEGTILIGGEDITTIKNSRKRKIFGYVEQSFHFIPGTVIEQISMKDESVSREAVIAVIQFVGLHECIVNLENSYDTIAMEYLFSQGQKQLLSIARAIVINPPIMLLDEMTANLDSDTENKIITVLKAAGKDRMLLSISHRLSSILSSERIITLENASIR
ncbi:MAG: ABC transporter ATP-binding protein [Lachnotalea sp.]